MANKYTNALAVDTVIGIKVMRNMRIMQRREGMSKNFEYPDITVGHRVSI